MPACPKCPPILLIVKINTRVIRLAGNTGVYQGFLYYRLALDAIDKYRADVVFNSPKIDLNSEEQAVELFAENVMKAGEILCLSANGWSIYAYLVPGFFGLPAIGQFRIAMPTKTMVSKKQIAAAGLRRAVHILEEIYTQSMIICF